MNYLKLVNFLKNSFLITAYFKNVGQGDSIILEWEKDNRKRYGIIDCTELNNNPILQHLVAKKVSEIEFIVLSHFHYDHFSGMADIFEYCIDNNVKVKNFYHSLAPFLSEILKRIFTSQKLQKGIARFFQAYDSFDKCVEDKIPVSNHIKELDLNESVKLSFLAPEGRVYEIMAKQLARKVAKVTTTNGDINKLSTIIKVYNKSNAFLLTSDATKKSFKQLRNKISDELVLVQAPHHGSRQNIDERFWNSIKKIAGCPSVFSVGDEPKDKLPNRETVAYFDINGFDVHSTNSVYGINDYFGFPPTRVHQRSTILNAFSRLRNTTQLIQPQSKFNGEQRFQLL